MPERNMERARKLGLWGLVSVWDDVRGAEWLETVLQIEENERGHRSLQRRLRGARLGRFKPMADFEWAWPVNADRNAIEALFSFAFLGDATNVILLGPNGVGKTMIAKNLAHEAVMRGANVLFTTAADMLTDLASQETASARQRRMRRYLRPGLLVVDEVGYLSYDNIHADLLFEVVNRRYEQAPILLTTNKPFSEWNEVFPNSTCVVTLVDRLVHHSEILQLDAPSYRLKEAKERATTRQRDRKKS